LVPDVLRRSRNDPGAIVHDLAIAHFNPARRSLRHRFGDSVPSPPYRSVSRKDRD
jgi:hypothetical protein